MAQRSQKVLPKKAEKEPSKGFLSSLRRKLSLTKKSKPKQEKWEAKVSGSVGSPAGVPSPPLADCARLGLQRSTSSGCQQERLFPCTPVVSCTSPEAALQPQQRWSFAGVLQGPRGNSRQATASYIQEHRLGNYQQRTQLNYSVQNYPREQEPRYPGVQHPSYSKDPRYLSYQEQQPYSIRPVSHGQNSVAHHRQYGGAQPVQNNIVQTEHYSIGHDLQYSVATSVQYSSTQDMLYSTASSVQNRAAQHGHSSLTQDASHNTADNGSTIQTQLAEHDTSHQHQHSQQRDVPFSPLEDLQYGEASPHAPGLGLYVLPEPPTTTPPHKSCECPMCYHSNRNPCLSCGCPSRSQHSPPSLPSKAPLPRYSAAGPPPPRPPRPMSMSSRSIEEIYSRSLERPVSAPPAREVGNTSL